MPPLLGETFGGFSSSQQAASNIFKKPGCSHQAKVASTDDMFDVMKECDVVFTATGSQARQTMTSFINICRRQVETFVITRIAYSTGCQVPCFLSALGFHAWKYLPLLLQVPIIHPENLEGPGVFVLQSFLGWLQGLQRLIRRKALLEMWETLLYLSSVRNYGCSDKLGYRAVPASAQECSCPEDVNGR